MSELAWFQRFVENFGATGLIAWVFYKLVDKWADRFWKAQTAQTEAMEAQAHGMAQLAGSVVQGQTDQRDTLIAVRVLARQVEEHKSYLVEISDRCQSMTCQAIRRAGGESGGESG